MKRLGNYATICICLALSLLLLSATAVKATESGGPSGALGAEDFYGGALPPPGFYYLNYLTYYESDRPTDKDGNRIPINFDLKAWADINRFVYITKYKILGADYGAQVIVPLVSLNVTTPGGSDSDSLLGDIVLTPIILGWHFSKNLHAVFGLDLFLPTGSYDKNEIANVGRNYYSTEIAAAFTYLADNGFEASAKFMYDINWENDDTDYKSGQEFHFDYLLGYHLGDWKLGVNGYYYKQMTDDELRGVSVPANPFNDEGKKGQVWAIGPAIGYSFKNHISVAAKYQKEIESKNMTEGDRFWLKVAIPF